MKRKKPTPKPPEPEPSPAEIKELEKRLYQYGESHFLYEFYNKPPKPPEKSWVDRTPPGIAPKLRAFNEKVMHALLPKKKERP